MVGPIPRVSRLLCPLARAVHGARRNARHLGVGEAAVFRAGRGVTEHLLETLPGVDPGMFVVRNDLVVSRGLRGVTIGLGEDFGHPVTEHLVAADELGFVVREIDGDFDVECPPHHVCAIETPFAGFVCPVDASDDYIHVHCRVVTSTQVPENLSGEVLDKPDDEQLVFEYLAPFAVPHL